MTHVLGFLASGIIALFSVCSAMIGGSNLQVIATAPRQALKLPRPLGSARAPSPAAGVPQQGNVRDAGRFPGADLGAKINAADKDLGSGPGEIRVTAAGTVSTPVTLSPNHTLALQAPTTWNATLGLANNAAIIGSGGASPLTVGFSPPGSLIHGSRVNDVRIENLVASAAARNPNYVLATVYGSNRVTVSNCKVTDMHLFESVSALLAYAAVTDDNSSHEITVTNNVATAGARLGGNGVIYIAYTRGATITGNKIENFDQGIEWWGGDSCVSGCAAGGGNGNLNNERKTQNLTIEHNTVSNVTGGIWGSMGQSVLVASNTVSNCADVCLDSEGGNSVTFSHNTVRDGANSALAMFWLNRDITFDSNTVTSTSSKKPLFRIYNATQDSALNRNVTLTGNEFECLDHTICSINSDSGPVGQITIIHNTFKNTNIRLAFTNQHIVDLENNTLQFDISNPTAFNAINVQHALQVARQAGWVKIINNTIRSQAAQPPGSRAIWVVQDDFNSSPVTSIQNNQLIGSHPFAIGIEAFANSSNPGITPVFVISGNTLSGGRIVTNAGKTGKISVRNENNHL